MKSKTKTILIFAAILAAVFLVAFLDGGAVQSAADEEEEGTLIGAFVSEEDIDIGGDLAVSAAGKFVWKAGRLYMETDDWSALGERGGGIYCTMEPDARYGEEDAKSPNITIFGALGAPLGKAGIDDDNGVRTTDIDLSDEVYACGDRQVIFKLYPIYQTSDGRIYLTRGNSMGMSGADGASVTHTLTRDKTETIGGKSERVKVRVAITAVSRPTPTKFTVAHMDENVHRHAQGRMRRSLEARGVRARRAARVYHCRGRRGVSHRHELWTRRGRRDGGIRHLQPQQ